MLDVIIIHFIDEMNNKLEQPITKEFKEFVEEMATRHCPIIFYEILAYYWVNYYKMVP